MSKLLVIDTSSDACSVVLVTDQLTAGKSVMGRQSHAAQLPGLVEGLLREHETPARELDGLAVAAGPGSFTGLRIGISVVQGLAFALGKPVVLLSTLELLASSAFNARGWRQILCATLARDGELYLGGFKIDQGGFPSPIAPATVCAPDELDPVSFSFDGGVWYGVGEGWSYEEELSMALSGRPQEIDTSVRISIESLAALARFRFAQGHTVEPEMALPVYLKERMQYRTVDDQ